MKAHALSFLVALALAPAARSELVALDIQRREAFAGGAAFGAVGGDEKLVGIARFAVDPEHERNAAVIDLKLAPRNKAGKVEFEADFCILAPKDRSRGNRALLYDVNNRGNKLALGMFNGVGGNDPTSLADAGNGFLFRRGYTIVWCGWIGELLPGNNRLLLRTPIVMENGKPVRGIVRYETCADAPAESLPLARREGMGSYPPGADAEKTGRLTWRLRETDPRVPIPNGQWSLEHKSIPIVENGVKGTLPQVRLTVAGGFRPGYLYELVCEADGPIVQGLGFCAVRDLLSFLRYDDGERNPLRRDDGKPAIARTHGFGVSQSGRFLRHFLWQDFNRDERGRRVFDGLMPHVAGGGLGYFNHRFAQPTRHNGQQEEHLYPGDRFPFTYGDAIDPFTKQRDGIARRTQNADPTCLPKVMHTQSAAEYWHRSGSLVHTDPRATEDATLPEYVRVYAFGGTQHGPAGDPPARGIGDNLTNPADYRPLLRALLDALDAWVEKGETPPPSVYPRIADGTLVDWRHDQTGFPRLPGVRQPEVIQQPSLNDYGPDFESRGLITVEPPRIVDRYVVKVPKSGSDGNDLGCLLIPDVAVPLATYTGWNLRRRDVGAEGQLFSLAGSYLPFAATKAEREKTGDPRPSLAERYGGFEGYRKQYAAACADLVRRRYLLAEDAERLEKGREKVRTRLPKAAR